MTLSSYEVPFDGKMTSDEFYENPSGIRKAVVQMLRNNIFRLRCLGSASINIECGMTVPGCLRDLTCTV